VNDARSATDAYVAAVNARDADALVALFASGGALHHPFGHTRHTRSNPRLLLRSRIAAKTVVTVERVEAEPGARTATVELVGRSPMSDDALQTVDYLTVDDAGAITELRVELL
jgi:SnoaL-like domain